MISGLVTISNEAKPVGWSLKITPARWIKKWFEKWLYRQTDKAFLALTGLAQILQQSPQLGHAQDYELLDYLEVVFSTLAEEMTGLVRVQQKAAEILPVIQSIRNTLIDAREMDVTEQLLATPASREFLQSQMEETEKLKSKILDLS